MIKKQIPIFIGEVKKNENFVSLLQKKKLHSTCIFLGNSIVLQIMNSQEDFLQTKRPLDRWIPIEYSINEKYSKFFREIYEKLTHFLWQFHRCNFVSTLNSGCFHALPKEQDSGGRKRWIGDYNGKYLSFQVRWSNEIFIKVLITWE